MRVLAVAGFAFGVLFDIGFAVALYVTNARMQRGHYYVDRGKYR